MTWFACRPCLLLDGAGFKAMTTSTAGLLVLTQCRPWHNTTTAVIALMQVIVGTACAAG
jgi:hypothetical protein